MKKALITGITGQDWAYLAELLLEKWYEVHGIKRRVSILHTNRIDHLYQSPEVRNRSFVLHYWDMTDSANLIKLVADIRPDEIYNIAAQSHVQVSFEMPEYTANTDGLWVLRLLEAIKINWLTKKTKFYQASTSELYGLVQEIPQKETTPFYPRSPYGCAKLYWYRITVNYRESYDMFACNWILFNHESPKRWETFVTRKITRAVAEIYIWLKKKLSLWNLNAKRDWWHAKDFVEWMWLMLQQDKPDDYVLATGETHTVREFVDWAFGVVWIEIEWKWVWVKEKWIDKKTGKTIVDVDPKYFRPCEVEILVWDPSKAKKILWWKPKYTLQQMIEEMVQDDVQLFLKQEVLRKHWYEILAQYE